MREVSKVAAVTALLAAAAMGLGLRIAGHGLPAKSDGAPVGKTDPCSGITCLLPQGEMDWRALATLLLVFAAVLLGLITWRLAKIARAEMSKTRADRAGTERKIERTVATCNRYETDAHLVAALARLRGVGDLPPLQYSHELSLLLNYLDTIAVGIEEDFYDHDRARVLMANILVLQCDRFLKEQLLTKARLDIRDYPALVALHRRWKSSRKIGALPAYPPLEQVTC